jgi:hypothetical protein
MAAHLDVRFWPDGPVRSVFVSDRARSVGRGTVATPWQGQFANHALRGGMVIPLSAEVSWLLPEGPQPYWRGEIASASFAYAGDSPAAAGSAV